VDIALFVKALGGLFAIMNPFVALPMFLTLTAGYAVPRQRRAALRTAAYSLVLALVILVGGKAILGFFGVGVDDFRIAGGIVLMTIALGMLSGKGSSAHEGTRPEQERLARAAQPAPGGGSGERSDESSDVAF
jgi:multiple antibiotic resistance protein